MRRIVLAQFCLLFLCIVVLFISTCLCLHVCVCAGLDLALRSCVDVDPSEEYQYPEQPPSSQQFEQQENFEEGKYNMNITYHF